MRLSILIDTHLKSARPICPKESVRRKLYSARCNLSASVFSLSRRIDWLIWRMRVLRLLKDAAGLMEVRPISAAKCFVPKLCRAN